MSKKEEQQYSGYNIYDKKLRTTGTRKSVFDYIKQQSRSKGWIVQEISSGRRWMPVHGHLVPV